MRYLFLLIIIASAAYCLDERRERALEGILTQIDDAKITAMDGLKIYYEKRPHGDYEEAKVATNQAYDELKHIWSDRVINQKTHGYDIIEVKIGECLEKLALLKDEKSDANRNKIIQKIIFLSWLSDGNSVDFDGEFPKIYF
jgi:hypothetical protein